MKTRLLKRLRQEAKKLYRVYPGPSGKYSVRTPNLGLLAICDTLELAIKECEAHRRFYIMTMLHLKKNGREKTKAIY